MAASMVAAHVEQRARVGPLAHELKTHGQVLLRLAARHHERRVSGKIERLRETQHQPADRQLRAVDGDRFLIESRRRDRRSRQDQRVDVREGGIDFFTNDSTARERAQVVLGEDVAALLDAQAHRRIVELRTVLERFRVIGRALGERDDQVDAGDVVRVGKLRRRDDGAARAQAVERVLVNRADAGFEQRLHEYRRDGTGACPSAAGWQAGARRAARGRRIPLRRRPPIAPGVPRDRTSC